VELPLDDPEETWAPIAEAPSYQVSTRGRVRRLVDGVELDVATWQNKGRYVCVNLDLPDGHPVLRYVHRLVATAFRSNRPSDATQVNHENGLKPDNRLENLAWTTPRGNVQHARDTGLIHPRPPQDTCAHGHPRDQAYQLHGRPGRRCARCRRVRARERRYGQPALLALLNG
jgi:hypothetical protein